MSLSLQRLANPEEIAKGFIGGIPSCLLLILEAAEIRRRDDGETRAPEGRVKNRGVVWFAIHRRVKILKNSSLRNFLFFWNILQMSALIFVHECDNAFVFMCKLQRQIQRTKKTTWTKKLHQADKHKHTDTQSHWCIPFIASWITNYQTPWVCAIFGCRPLPGY